MTKIALIGPGAIGGMLAAWLSTRSNHGLSICARTTFETLTVESPFGTIETKPQFYSEPGKAKPVDWVLICTKTYHLQNAASWFGSLCHEGTKVAVIQNGVEHLANLKPFVPESSIVPVIIDCPVERSAPGKILQRDFIKMVVPDNEASAEFASLFPEENISTILTDNWTTEAWKKLCINSGGAISALINAPANIVRDENAANVMRKLIQECILVARAEGASIDDAIIEQIVATQSAAPDGAMNSIHADLVAQRPMEWNARNGVIVRLGKRHGISTPYNELAVDLLKALEANYLDH